MSLFYLIASLATVGSDEMVDMNTMAKICLELAGKSDVTIKVLFILNLS